MVKYELPPLPYSYNALEPHMDEATLRIHHTRLHQDYTDGLNDALSRINALNHKNYIIGILAELDSVPEHSREQVNFYGGGYENHKFFWESMRPGTASTPKGRLSDEIVVYFGGFEKFKEKFSQNALDLQGSGWCWMVYNRTYSRLELLTTTNQTSPHTKRMIPLLGLDMWEHAYYLKYKSDKSSYVRDWWNLVNWPIVEERLIRVAT